MTARAQAGFSLIEAAVAAAIVALAAGGWIAAMSAFARFSAQQAGPARSAALLLAEQTLRTAEDAWKYGSPGSAPAGSWQTELPAMPGAPATIAAALSNPGSTSSAITVTVRYTPDPQRKGDPGVVTLSARLTVKAPAPGSTVAAPQLVPQPSGAP